MVCKSVQCWALCDGPVKLRAPLPHLLQNQHYFVCTLQVHDHGHKNMPLVWCTHKTSTAAHRINTCSYKAAGLATTAASALCIPTPPSSSETASSSQIWRLAGTSSPRNTSTRQHTTSFRMDVATCDSSRKVKPASQR